MKNVTCYFRILNPDLNLHSEVEEASASSMTRTGKGFQMRSIGVINMGLVIVFTVHTACGSEPKSPPAKKQPAVQQPQGPSTFIGTGQGQQNFGNQPPVTATPPNQTIPGQYTLPPNSDGCLQQIMGVLSGFSGTPLQGQTPNNNAQLNQLLQQYLPALSGSGIDMNQISSMLGGTNCSSLLSQFGGGSTLPGTTPPMTSGP